MPVLTEDMLRAEGLNAQVPEEIFAQLKTALLDNFDRYEKFFADLPRKLGEQLDWPGDDATLELCKRAELVERKGSSHLPKFRLVRVGDVFVSTDFPSREVHDRVFPWNDEAELVLKQVAHCYPDAGPRRVLNPCCRAGTIAIALAKQWPASSLIALDNNRRACERTLFNKRLNRTLDASSKALSNLAIHCGELSDAEPGPFDLIVATPPFALQPPGWREYGHSSGGGHGDLIVRELLIKAAACLTNKTGRLILLTYSLGTEQAPTRLLSLLKTYFPAIECSAWEDKSDPKPKLQMAADSVWRFGNHKCIPCNPMPLEYMVVRFGDPSYMTHKRIDVPERELVANVGEYVRWIEDDLKKEEGYSHLHYVIASFNAPDVRMP